jgi:hypothetical protein
MSILPDTARRWGHDQGPRDITTHRQPRPADPDLVQLDRRIVALEALGDTRSRAWAVALLRRRWQHLDRDKESRLAGWFTDAASLALRITQEEAAGGY